MMIVTTSCTDDGPLVSLPTSTPSVPIDHGTGVVIPVVALDNSFRPQIVEISVGDAVSWENRGLNAHDVLHVEGVQPDGSTWGVTVTDFQPDDVFTHRFTEPGEYAYYCSIHGNEKVGMVGTVLVSA